MDDFGAGPLPGSALGDLTEDDRRVYFLSYGRGSPGILKGRKLDYPGHIGFREGDLKFFVDRKRFRRGTEGRCFLYDLSVDPHEMNNLCEQDGTDSRASSNRDELVEWYNSTTAMRSDLLKKK